MIESARATVTLQSEKPQGIDRQVDSGSALSFGRKVIRYSRRGEEARCVSTKPSQWL